MRQADYPLIPVVDIPSKVGKDQFIELIEVAEVGDWSTLCIDASVTPADLGSFNAGAAVIQVFFYQKSGQSLIPQNSNLKIVGGRSLCTGLSDQRSFYIESSLDVRLPIISPYVGIRLYFPSNQTDMTGITIGAWCTNDPSYQYGNPFPVGYFTNTTATAGDSYLGSNNAGTYNDFTRGILVPANTVRVVELTEQTIGKGSFMFFCESTSGAPITGPEVGTWVCNKSFNDTTGNTMDQVLYNFGNNTTGIANGVPLTAFRQSVAMFNATGGAPRDVVWHWTVYPEFV